MSFVFKNTYKIYSSIVIGCVLFFPHILFAALPQLSISPSESEIQVLQGESVQGSFILQRKDADEEQLYVVTVEAKEPIEGVSVTAEQITLVQGEIEKTYQYTVQCSSLCLGTGTYIIRIVPTIAVQSNGVGVQAGIAHRIRIQAIEQDTRTETVSAASLTNTNELITFSSLIGRHRFFEPDAPIEMALTFSNSSDKNISNLAYTVQAFLGTKQMFSQQTILSESIPANGVVKTTWMGSVGDVGEYRYVFTAAGETQEVSVYVSYIQKIALWLIVCSVLSLLLWFVRPYIQRFVFQGKGQLLRSRFIMMCMVLIVCGVVLGCAYIALPHARQTAAWSGPQYPDPHFAVVADAGRYTVLRLNDGQTQHLSGEWSFFVSQNDHFYAVPQRNSPNTEQRYFYRIFNSEIQPFAADVFSSQITTIQENAPGTYAIVSGVDFVCIFKTTEANAPACQDLSSISLAGTIRSAEWMDDSGQYVALSVESLDGNIRVIRYDAWNRVGELLSDYTFKNETPAYAAPVAFDAPSSFLRRATISAFDRTYWAPWNTSTAAVNEKLVLALILTKEGRTLSFMQDSGEYYLALPVSSEAAIYLLRKGTVVTNPLISDR